MITCPYCRTENPADAIECHNCSADLTFLTTGKKPAPVEGDPARRGRDTEAESSTPPPESTAPTMISSSAEVAAMLEGEKAAEESEPEPVAEDPSAKEPASVEREPAEPPTPDYAAPTMMSSSAEVAATLAAAKSLEESETEPVAEETTKEEPSAELLVDSEPEQEIGYETPAIEEPVDPALSAPTLFGIPDPLGGIEEDEPAEPESVLQIDETPTPLINEAVVVPTSPPPDVEQPARRPSVSSSMPVFEKKGRTLTVGLELLGLIGFQGIGWLYAGNIVAGVVALVGFWIWNLIALVLDFITIGIFLCLHIPTNLAITGISTFLLYRHTQDNPDKFE